MASTQRKEKPQAKKSEPEVADLPSADAKEKLKKDIDDILDEIDDALMENAEQFVSGFVQKGGQ